MVNDYISFQSTLCVSFDKTSENRLCGHSLVKKNHTESPFVFFLWIFWRWVDLKFEVQTEKTSPLSVKISDFKIKRKKSMRHAFTQQQSASPKSAYLVFSLGKSSSTQDSGIHLSELCPLHKCTTRLLYNVYNSLLDWRLCVKTARRSPCQRLCETGAQWRLHKVL